MDHHGMLHDLLHMLLQAFAIIGSQLPLIHCNQFSGTLSLQRVLQLVVEVAQFLLLELLLLQELVIVVHNFIHS